MKRASRQQLFFFFVASIFVSSMIPSSPTLAQEDITEIVVAVAEPFDGEYSQFTVYRKSARQMLSTTYAGLYRYDSDLAGSFRSELAEGFPTVEDDGLNYTITLRSGAKFSDGTTVTADDVVFTYQALLSPEIHVGHIQGYVESNYDMIAAYLTNDSIVKVSENQVRFELKEQIGHVFSLFVYPIQPKAIFEQRFLSGNYNWNASDYSDTLSAGPYMIDDHNDTSVTLVKNPHYWNIENVVTDTFIFKYIPDFEDALSELVNGTVHILSSTYDHEYDAFEGIETLKFEESPIPTVEILGLNHHHEYFGTGESLSVSNKSEGASNVRKAISSIVDRERISTAIDDFRVPAASIITSGVLEHEERYSPRNYSVTDSIAYMELAGFDYATLGTPDGDGNYPSFFFNITLFTWEGAYRETTNNILAESLPKIGIGVTLNTVPTVVDYLNRGIFYPDTPPVYDDGGYDVYSFGIAHGMTLELVEILSASHMRNVNPEGHNFLNFNNSYHDRLMEELSVNTNYFERKEIANQLQDFYMEWEPVIPVYQQVEMWAFNPDIHNYNIVLMENFRAEWDRIIGGKVIDMYIDSPIPNVTGGPQGLFENIQFTLGGFYTLFLVMALFFVFQLIRGNVSSTIGTTEKAAKTGIQTIDAFSSKEHKRKEREKREAEGSPRKLGYRFKRVVALLGITISAIIISLPALDPYMHFLDDLI